MVPFVGETPYVWRSGGGVPALWAGKKTVARRLAEAYNLEAPLLGRSHSGLLNLPTKEICLENRRSP